MKQRNQPLLDTSAGNEVRAEMPSGGHQVAIIRRELEDDLARSELIISLDTRAKCIGYLRA